MSKTDKTNPYWIHVQHPPKGVTIVARHRCGNGRECDLGVYLPAQRAEHIRHAGHWRSIILPRCQLWPKSYHCDKIYGRHPKQSTRKALGFEGAIRADLRRLRRHWASEPDRESIDSSWGAPRRRCQVRDPWHWD